MQQQQQERWSMQPHQQKRQRISMMSASGDCQPQQGMSPLRGGHLYPWRMYQFNGAMRYCVWIDQRYEVTAAEVWSHCSHFEAWRCNDRWSVLMGQVSTRSLHWCGKCACGHSKISRSIRVGTYSSRKNDCRKAGWRAPKICLKKKSPLVPRYILWRYQYIRERHMDKSARLAMIWFQNSDIAYPLTWRNPSGWPAQPGLTWRN